MTTLNRTFEVGGDRIHAVVLEQRSKHRWHAFLWGGGLRFANTFARRQGAEQWLNKVLSRYFPSFAPEIASSRQTCAEMGPGRDLLA